MSIWKDARIPVAVALLAWGCGMAENAVFEPKPIVGMSEAPAGEDSKKLDAELTAFLRNKHAIASARYYRVPADIAWMALTKSVQNQMAEKSIQRIMFDWFEPGLDLVEMYPQGKSGAGFALAMPKGTNPKADKLVGFYVLGAPAGTKK